MHHESRSPAKPKGHPASFRDPAGFMYRSAEGALLRQVNEAGQQDYERLMASGLYDELIGRGHLIDHEEVDAATPHTSDTSDPSTAYKTLKPRLLPSISNPYEWSFSAYKAAALLTLEIQKRAIAQGLSLKDASAYNIQFEGWKPVFIDTLSFEAYEEGQPWVAYGQFCRHFLAPIALMAYRELSLGRLTSLHLDGVPLDTTCRLLPLRCRLRPGLLMHLFANARLTTSFSDTNSPSKERKAPHVSQQGLIALLENLEKTIAGLQLKGHATTWGDYYQNNTYDQGAQQEKASAVRGYLTQVAPQSVWDLGANTGLYSRIAADLGAETVAFDIDPICVERNYKECVKEDRRNLTPLTLDLTNPSPGIGWANRERESIASRGPVDAVMALALIHHLAIANNVPLGKIADYFQTLGEHLIIEWVPKDDPQVQRLLRSRRDIFDRYTREEFEAEFGERFELLAQQPSGADNRVLYLMKNRQAAAIRLAG